MTDEPRDPPEVRQHRFEPPPGATRLLLVRHGESEPARPDRPFPLVDGHGDPALHPEGRAQARRVADRLAAEAIDAIYVSSLRRTHETAAPLAERLGLEARVEPDLREVFLGEWEGGRLRVRAAQGDPLVGEIYRQERWDVIPGAEPMEAFAERVAAAVGRIVAAHPGRQVVAVAHGGVIAEVLAQATGARRFAFSGIDNASISELVVTGERTILRRFNDTSHLG